MNPLFMATEQAASPPPHTQAYLHTGPPKPLRKGQPEGGAAAVLHSRGKEHGWTAPFLTPH